MTDAGYCGFRRFIACCGLFLASLTQAAPAVHTAHGFTLFGELKYGPGATHFDYVNPDAPKGGTYRFSFSSTFDNLNPFIVAGSAPIASLPPLVYESLMQRSGDEPASIYGLVAESVSYPEDFAWAEFGCATGRASMTARRLRQRKCLPPQGLKTL